jgi:adenylate kinase family enzyme
LQRIVVLGCAGSGKTRFARALADTIGATPVILDEVWRPAWGPFDLERFRVLIDQAHAADRWVSDGNFAVASLDLRLPRADLVIWLERPRWACLWRATMRVFQPGEAHQLTDLAKVWAFIWNFDQINRPHIEAQLAAHRPMLRRIQLTDDRQTSAFLEDARRESELSQPASGRRPAPPAAPV